MPGGEETEDDLCRYSGYLCHQDKLKHYDFCMRHILEDKTAPFKQCTYNIKSQKRCLRPAPRADKKDGYCVEHARKALTNRHKLLSKKNHVELSTRCLSDLKHYDEAASSSADGCSDPKHPRLKPIDASSASRPHPYELLSRRGPISSVVEGGGEESEEDDDEDIRVDQTWKGDGESDAESLDSDHLDTPLKHAGVYTPEEIVRIMRDKLIRLQKSYIDQFQRLQYLLREERRVYKHAVQKEKESLMSIHLQPKESESERSAYRLIKSLNHYHRRQGKEALLASKVAEKRRRASEPGTSTSGSTSSSHSNANRCSFNITSHIKCCEPSIPLSKYCLKHILQDSSQVLFRRCGFLTPADEGPCEAPVPNTFDDTTCVYHTYIPPIISKKEESFKPEPKLKDGGTLSVKVELIENNVPDTKTSEENIPAQPAKEERKDEAPAVDEYLSPVLEDEPREVDKMKSRGGKTNGPCEKDSAPSSETAPVSPNL